MVNPRFEHSEAAGAVAHPEYIVLWIASILMTFLAWTVRDIIRSATDTPGPGYAVTAESGTSVIPQPSRDRNPAYRKLPPRNATNLPRALG